MFAAAEVENTQPLREQILIITTLTEKILSENELITDNNSDSLR
jgi:hypothetical protein